MELRVNEVTIPEKISFNYEELKAELTEKVAFYETLVYTDDQVKDAKADRATLNKLKKTLNDERIRREKEYMQPFNEFKAQVNEIIGIIDKPIAVIDKQVKEFENQKKANKQNAIEELFAGMGFQSFVTLEKIWDPKWLNASTSMKSIEEQMRSRMYEIGDNVLRISQFPEFSFEAMEAFKETLLIDTAVDVVQKNREMEQKKAAAKAAEEARKAEEERKAKEIKEEQTVIAPAEPNEQAVTPPEPVQSADSTQERMVVRFEVLLTTEDAYALKEFFKSRSIEFKAI